MNIPECWQGYELLDEVGFGSHGQVYRIKKTIAGTEFISAMKVITLYDDTLSPDDSAALIEDYKHEINVLFRLRDCPQIVRLEDYYTEQFTAEEDGESGSRIYIRMEYVESLPSYLIRHILTEEDILRLAEDISLALSACEQAGILHRDIKPGNIFVDKSGHFKLGDFGESRFVDTLSEHSLRGTYIYMAPEAAPYKDRADNRSDLYSLGLVLYELLNENWLPFLNPEHLIPSDDEKAAALSRRLGGEALPDPAHGAAWFSKAVLRCCAYDPDDRFATAAAFRRALAEKSADPEKGGSDTALPAAKKSRAPAITAGILAVTAALIGLMYFRLAPSHRPVEDQTEMLLTEAASEETPLTEYLSTEKVTEQARPLEITTLALKDYVDISYDGCNGAATPQVKLNSLQLDAAVIQLLYQNNLLSESLRLKAESLKNSCDVALIQELIRDQELYDIFYQLSQNVRVSCDAAGFVSNGDILTISFDYWEDALADYGIRLAGDDYTATVEGLEAPPEVDLFDQIIVSFSGLEGYGTANISFNTEGGRNLFDQYQLMYDLTPSNGLKNGDTVTLSLSWMHSDDGSFTDAFCQVYGVVPSKTEQTYVVSGLKTDRRSGDYGGI